MATNPDFQIPGVPQTPASPLPSSYLEGLLKGLADTTAQQGAAAGAPGQWSANPFPAGYTPSPTPQAQQWAATKDWNMPSFRNPYQQWATTPGYDASQWQSPVFGQLQALWNAYGIGDRMTSFMAGPGAYNPSAVWEPGQASAAPVWLQPIIDAGPSMSAADKQAAYNHYVLGMGVAPMYQEAHNAMPADVKAMLAAALS